MRCLRSGGRMLSRIRFSCSRAVLLGPWLLTTLLAENRIQLRKRSLAFWTKVKDNKIKVTCWKVKCSYLDNLWLLSEEIYMRSILSYETQDIFSRQKILTYQPLRNPKILTRKYLLYSNQSFIFISKVEILLPGQCFNRMFQYLTGQLAFHFYTPFCHYLPHTLQARTFDDLY